MRVELIGFCGMDEIIPNEEIIGVSRNRSRRMRYYESEEKNLFETDLMILKKHNTRYRVREDTFNGVYVVTENNVRLAESLGYI